MKIKIKNMEVNSVKDIDEPFWALWILFLMPLKRVATVRFGNAVAMRI